MNAFAAAEQNGKAADLPKEIEALFERQNKSEQPTTAAATGRTAPTIRNPTSCTCRQYIAIAAGGGAIAALVVGMTKEADTASGSNAMYVFALPQ